VLRQPGYVVALIERLLESEQARAVSLLLFRLSGSRSLFRVSLTPDPIRERLEPLKELGGNLELLGGLTTQSIGEEVVGKLDPARPNLAAPTPIHMVEDRVL
jgi:hypothetical protein